MGKGHIAAKYTVKLFTVSVGNPVDKMQITRLSLGKIIRAQKIYSNKITGQENSKQTL